MPRTDLAECVARARAFVIEINTRTICAHCGAQPIDWHNPEHVELNRKNFRIPALVCRGYTVEDIQAEMKRCTPLCRRCHMIVDGRMSVFMKHALAPKTQSPKPCAQCSRLSKPLRRGFCGACDAQRRRRVRAS